MKPYTCPNCKRHYDVRPKHCACEKAQTNDKPQVQYALVIRNEEGFVKQQHQLSKQTYEACLDLLKQNGKRPQSSKYQLLTEVIEPGVETLEHSSPLEVFDLSEEEYQVCLQHIQK